MSYSELPADFDAWVTGHWGEDQFDDDPEPDINDEKSHRDWRWRNECDAPDDFEPEDFNERRCKDD